ncbi:Tim44/TimA family putative adaptor protein [Rhizorhapis sp. SPR117]|uniref:Tim44/TimA family putative adaptor protein n=1 Tax=Rhizorhapis sp. SPR117 TaxID=2912611 RepID=UPI001F43FBCC|nr:Tim44/TimA family putative adaptor protein [Rhizorhapis sp. SPR117]
MTVVVILAMVAAFLGLRLYSVLGKRTGHEQQPAPQAEERVSTTVLTPVRVEDIRPEVGRLPESLVAPAAESGIRAIIGADRRFDLTQFAEGAKSAYRMILEAFWKGDKDELAYLCDSDVHASFAQAIDAREAEGHILENRMIRIDKAQIADASLSGTVASITLRFDADIAAVTRDRDGHVIAGSMTDAVSTHDVWTFSRDVKDSDPNWKLTETDEAA